MDDFKDKYKVDLSDTRDDDIKVYTGQSHFDPNSAAREIENELFKEFVALVKGTPNESLIAFKDSKIQELTDYIMCAIIIENERLNAPDAFPLQIHSRLKSNKSFKDKVDEWSKRDDRKHEQISDFLGFKIVPESEPPVFYSGGDLVLREMIDKKEKIRNFVVKIYRDIEKNPSMTYAQYCRKTIKVLKKLIDIFPKEATARIQYYEELIEKIKNSLAAYQDMFEDHEKPMSFKQISAIADVNLGTVISELTKNYHCEVVLYKLRKNLINIFENSDLLKSLRTICIR